MGLTPEPFMQFKMEAVSELGVSQSGCTWNSFFFFAWQAPLIARGDIFCRIFAVFSLEDLLWRVEIPKVCLLLLFFGSMVFLRFFFGFWLQDMKQRGKLQRDFIDFVLRPLWVP